MGTSERARAATFEPHYSNRAALRAASTVNGRHYLSTVRCTLPLGPRAWEERAWEERAWEDRKGEEKRGKERRPLPPLRSGRGGLCDSASRGHLGCIVGVDRADARLLGWRYRRNWDDTMADQERHPMGRVDETYVRYYASVTRSRKMRLMSSQVERSQMECSAIFHQMLIWLMENRPDRTGAMGWSDTKHEALESYLQFACADPTIELDVVFDGLMLAGLVEFDFKTLRLVTWPDYEGYALDGPRRKRQQSKEREGGEAGGTPT